MPATHDSITFGYADFYTAYLGVPYIHGLVELTRAQIIHPSDFSAHDPRHVCLAALHGHMIYPVDEHTIKVRVESDSSYAKTIATRIDNFKQMVAKFNAKQKCISPYFGGAITIEIDDNDPFTAEQFEMVGLGGSVIANAALQYEVDRKFLNLGRSGRLNHFAQHYGFANLTKLKAFIDRLDVEAQVLGFQSYATICTSTRHMKFLEEKYRGQFGMKPALDALHEKRDLLQRESVFTIERFMACRVVDSCEPYFVDVNAEGVLIELREGRFKGTGIVSSRFLSDRNDEFHSAWFA